MVSSKKGVEVRGWLAAYQVRHQQRVQFRVVEGVWDGRVAVLTRVVHSLQPVIRQVFAGGRGGEKEVWYGLQLPTRERERERKRERRECVSL